MTQLRLALLCVFSLFPTLVFPPVYLVPNLSHAPLFPEISIFLKLLFLYFPSCTCCIVYFLSNSLPSQPDLNEKRRPLSTDKILSVG